MYIIFKLDKGKLNEIVLWESKDKDRMIHINKTNF